MVTLEVKPWDDETDMKKLEEAVRTVQMEGLLWGASKLVPVGYGVSKLQITLVIGACHRFLCTRPDPGTDAAPVEDELVSLDELQEKIQELEDYVQSTDVAAMQSAFARPRSLHDGCSPCIPRRAVMCCLLRILSSAVLRRGKRRVHLQLGLYRRSSAGVLAHVLYYPVLRSTHRNTSFSHRRGARTRPSGPWSWHCSSHIRGG